MSFYLGIDTSCYTTSAAVVDSEHFSIDGLSEQRRILDVKAGEKGLRQSDIVYAHVRNLPVLLEPLLLKYGRELKAIGASVRPRDMEGSYMPCFETGAGFARSLAAALKVPFFSFSHQAGHIASALFSVNRLDLLTAPLLAFHVSGGTTEAVICIPKDDHMDFRIAARSLDLKAGQAVDRVGVMLGLHFPAGPGLEQLALQSRRDFNPRPSMKGSDCCLSGIENQCRKMKNEGAEPCDIASYCLSSIRAALEGMLLSLKKEYPDIPVLFAGGVMSNSLIRKYLSEKYAVLFANPRFSPDNASGIAVLTQRKAVSL